MERSLILLPFTFKFFQPCNQETGAPVHKTVSNHALSCDEPKIRLIKAAAGGGGTSERTP